jgi:hypothetical protein
MVFPIVAASPTVDHDLNKIEYALYQKAPCLDIYNVCIARVQSLKNAGLKVWEDLITQSRYSLLEDTRLPNIHYSRSQVCFVQHGQKGIDALPSTFFIPSDVSVVFSEKQLRYNNYVIDIYHYLQREIQ